MSFRSARENAGYSTRDVAHMLEINQSAVVHWESGRNLPRAATLARLAALYCCTIEQLLEPDVREPPELNSVGKEARV